MGAPVGSGVGAAVGDFVCTIQSPTLVTLRGAVITLPHVCTQIEGQPEALWWCHGHHPGLLSRPSLPSLPSLLCPSFPAMPLPSLPCPLPSLSWSYHACKASLKSTRCPWPASPTEPWPWADSTTWVPNETALLLASRRKCAALLSPVFTIRAIQALGTTQHHDQGCDTEPGMAWGPFRAYLSHPTT